MRFETYKVKGGWRWRLIASNGKIVANGGEVLTKRPTKWQILRVMLMATPV